MENKNFMIYAYKEAIKAYNKNEVPVGCVIVKDNKIIARAHNLRETTNSPLAHAEILAIAKAAKKLNSWRLEGCSIYVTLEPCMMCAGAIIQARIENLYFGAFDYKTGASGSIVNLFEIKTTHKLNEYKYVCYEPCKEILKDFFKTLRT